MSEAAMYRALKRAVGTCWSCTRHEDKNSIGIPDLSFVTLRRSGWLELKYKKVAPPSSEPLGVKNLRPAQRKWLKTRGKFNRELVGVLVGTGPISRLMFYYIDWEDLENMNRWASEKFGPLTIAEVTDLLGA